MATITLEFNPRSKFATALINLIKVSDTVKIVESPYDPEFVNKIKRAEASKIQKVIKSEDIWK